MWNLGLLRTLRPSGIGSVFWRNGFRIHGRLTTKRYGQNGDVLMLFAPVGIGQNAETEEGRAGRTGSQELKPGRSGLRSTEFGGLRYPVSSGRAGLTGCIDCKFKRKRPRIGMLDGS